MEETVDIRLMLQMDMEGLLDYLSEKGHHKIVQESTYEEEVTLG
jgi:hypothetical protein